MKSPSDPAQFPTRSLAAKYALKSGMYAFECVGYGQGDGLYYEVVSRRSNPMHEYAMLWAADKDYVHHVECSEDGFPIIVVTCMPGDVDKDTEDYFKIVPLTPSMLTIDRVRIERKSPIKPAPVETRPSFTLVPVIGSILPRITLNPITGAPIS